MQWLPVLRHGTAEWRLPLADQTAALLAEAFLAEAPDERLRCIERALGNDPPLALWTLSSTGDLESHPSTVPNLAAWLATDGLGVMSWEVETSVHDPPNGPELQRFAELVADSLARAQGQPLDRYLLCLMSNADRWLTSTGPPVTWSQIEAGETCVPLWCARPLSDLGGSWSPAEVDDKWLAEQISCWSTPVPGAGRNLRSLFAKFDRLRSLEKNFAKALESEKLLSLKQFAYGAGHEINNPLVNISTRAQTLLGDERDPERRRKLATINSQAFRAHEMISDLMLFAQPPQLIPQRIDLVQVIQQLADQFAEQASAHNVRIRWMAMAEPVVVSADPDQLQVALGAICTNALDAIAHGGTIEIELTTTDEIINHAKFAAIHIRDTGPGIPAEVRRHMFDPFFSGREAGRGIGFGLSKCWRIVTDHGGSIVVDSQFGSGATFTVLLPRAQWTNDEMPDDKRMTKHE